HGVLADRRARRMVDLVVAVVVREADDTEVLTRRQGRAGKGVQKCRSAHSANPDEAPVVVHSDPRRRQRTEARAAPRAEGLARRGARGETGSPDEARGDEATHHATASEGSADSSARSCLRVW